MPVPYLLFDGQCGQAIEFYKSTLGATVTGLMRYSESPEPMPANLPKFDPQWIMHASLKIDGLELMMSDDCYGSGSKFASFALALVSKSASEVERRFNALSAGGQVTMPLAKTFWSDSFGMLIDPFGVHWMLMVTECSANPSHKE